MTPEQAKTKRCPFLDDVDYCIGSKCMAFKQKKKICSRCDGTGSTTQFTGSGADLEMYTMKCLDCFGTGKVLMRDDYYCSKVGNELYLFEEK